MASAPCGRPRLRGRRREPRLHGEGGGPIADAQRATGPLLIQEMQSERTWRALIEERTGRGVGEGIGVIAGTCITL